MTRTIYEYESFTFYQLRRMLDGDAITAPRDAQAAKLRESLSSGFRVHTIIGEADFVLIERATVQDAAPLPNIEIPKRGRIPASGMGRSLSDVLPFPHVVMDFDPRDIVMYMPSHSSGTLDPVNEWAFIERSGLNDDYVFIRSTNRSVTSTQVTRLVKIDDLWPNEQCHWKTAMDKLIDSESESK